MQGFSWVFWNPKAIWGSELVQTRAADDFATIGARYKELTATPDPKRSGSPTNHCAHCPREGHESCNLNCAEEGAKVGVVAGYGVERPYLG
jgi:hypothetical protein